MEQEPVFNEKFTINELLYNSNAEVVKIIREYESALEMQTNEYNDTNAERFEKASINMEKVDGWNFDNELKQILSKFKIVDLEAKVEMLSGGQKSVWLWHCCLLMHRICCCLTSQPIIWILK